MLSSGSRQDARTIGPPAVLHIRYTGSRSGEPMQKSTSHSKSCPAGWRFIYCERLGASHWIAVYIFHVLEHRLTLCSALPPGIGQTKVTIDAIGYIE